MEGKINRVDYAPCLQIHPTRLSSNIYCSNVPLNDIGQMFQRKHSECNGCNNMFSKFQLLVQPNDLAIPADFLANHVAYRLTISCQALGTQRLQVDPDAFRSSRNVTYRIAISYCDLTGFSFEFLRGFQRLTTIELNSDANVQLAHWDSLPHLIIFDQLAITFCTGLDELPIVLRDFTSKDGFSRIVLSGNEIGDEAMDKILQQRGLNSPSTSLILDLGNNALTRIPPSLASFKNLDQLHLDHNPIKIIPAGLINPVRLLDMFYCDVEFIEPGALKGLNIFAYNICNGPSVLQHRCFSYRRFIYWEMGD